MANASKVSSGKSGTSGRSAIFDALHLAVLSGFAFAQPMFDVLGRDATFFVARRSESVDILLLTLTPILFLPVVLAGLEWIVGRFGPAPRRVLHASLVAVLLGVALLLPMKRAFGGAVLALPVALALGAGGAVAYSRWKAVRSFLTILGPAPLLFAGLFLMRPSVGAFLRPRAAVETRLPTVAAKTSVVLVVLDELPLASLMNGVREIDANLFPSFARLASRSTWFRNATASHESTPVAIPAIMTGQIAIGADPIPTAEGHPDNIFTLLGGSYRLKVWETLTDVCPPELVDGRPPSSTTLEERLTSLADDVSVVYAHVVLPDALTAGLPSVTRNWGGFRKEVADERLDTSGRLERKNVIAREGRTQIFREFVASIDDNPDPTLYFLHILLPHGAWVHMPSGAVYDDASLPVGRDAVRWVGDPLVTGLAYQRHLLQLGHVDRLLGELLDRLEEDEIFERSLVIVLADHGINFEPGGALRQTTEENLRAILHVPLFVKEPFQPAGRVSDRNVETVDVLPTVAAVLNVDLPWKAEGESMLDTDEPERPVKTLHRKLARPLRVEPDLPTRWPALERKLALFGSPPGWDHMFAMGTHRSLLGSAVSEMGGKAARGLRVFIEQDGVIASVDRASGKVPCYVTGRISAAADTVPPTDVAIAINGKIHAVAPTLERTEREALFAVMLPDGAFHDGANEVEVLAMPARRWIPRAGGQGQRR